MCPFHLECFLDEAEVGTPIGYPAVVTERIHNESGIVDRGSPLMRIRLGEIEYEFRAGFRCFLSVKVIGGQILEPGALLASGGADGEEAPDRGAR